MNSCLIPKSFTKFSYNTDFARSNAVPSFILESGKTAYSKLHRLQNLLDLTTYKYFTISCKFKDYGHKFLLGLSFNFPGLAFGSLGNFYFKLKVNSSLLVSLCPQILGNCIKGISIWDLLIWS